MADDSLPKIDNSDPPPRRFTQIDLRQIVRGNYQSHKKQTPARRIVIKIGEVPCPDIRLGLDTGLAKFAIPSALDIAKAFERQERQRREDALRPTIAAYRPPINDSLASLVTPALSGMLYRKSISAVPDFSTLGNGAASNQLASSAAFSGVRAAEEAMAKAALYGQLVSDPTNTSLAGLATPKLSDIAENIMRQSEKAASSSQLALLDTSGAVRVAEEAAKRERQILNGIISPTVLDLSGQLALSNTFTATALHDQLTASAKAASSSQLVSDLISGLVTPNLYIDASAVARPALESQPFSATGVAALRATQAAFDPWRTAASMAQTALKGVDSIATLALESQKLHVPDFSAINSLQSILLNDPSVRGLAYASAALNFTGELKNRVGGLSAASSWPEITKASELVASWHDYGNTVRNYVERYHEWPEKPPRRRRRRGAGISHRERAENTALRNENHALKAEDAEKDKKIAEIEATLQDTTCQLEEANRTILYQAKLIASLQPENEKLTVESQPPKRKKPTDEIKAALKDFIDAVGQRHNKKHGEGSFDRFGIPSGTKPFFEFCKAYWRHKNPNKPSIFISETALNEHRKGICSFRQSGPPTVAKRQYFKDLFPEVPLLAD